MAGLLRGYAGIDGQQSARDTVFMYSIGMLLPLPRPDVWWADQLAPSEQPTTPTGWLALDTALPGRGWPLGALVECAVTPGTLPWRLLQPVLQAAAAQGPIVLIGLPLEPHTPAWAAQGVAPSRLLRVHTHADADALWAAEQVLHCPDVAVCWVHARQPTVAWMRRLQLAAAAARRDATRPGAWPAPLVLASVEAAHALPASAAPLRLSVEPGDADGLRIHVRKRRGPPVPHPIWLNAPLPLRRLLPVPDAHSIQPNTPHVAPCSVDRLPAHWPLACA